MTMHTCPRCGLETHCVQGGWADRHAAAAVTAGLYTLTLMAIMFSIHPIAALAMIAVTAVTATVCLAVGERRRRDALAARADYEYRALMGRTGNGWSAVSGTQGIYGPGAYAAAAQQPVSCSANAGQSYF
jgi:hypothetical protein